VFLIHFLPEQLSLKKELSIMNYRFAAYTLASKSLVLVTVKFIDTEQLEVCVNCEKMVIGSILLNEFKSNFK